MRIKKGSKRITLLLFIFFSLLQTLVAQSQNVTGKVVDPQGSGVPGVTVTVRGTTTATQTSADGSYTIRAADNATLVFTSVGFGTQEVTASKAGNVSLQTTASNLSDVVVIGYGTARRRDVTGAVASVKSTEFNQGNITSPLQQLQGKAAGVVITQAGGDPNGGISVRVRGLTSLSTAQGSGSPLYVIDGIVGADINAVGPNDIETIDILKDASSAAIYGARGANGVVLITTKKGRSGSTKVEYNGYVSADHLSKKLPVLNGPEYKSAYLASGRLSANLLDKGANTDWQDEITRTAFSHNNSIAMSGGSEKSNYRASITYINQEGIILNTERKYLNGRINMNQKALNNKVNVALALAYTNQKKNFIDYYSDATSQVAQENPFIYALNYSPLLPIYNPDGSFFNVPGFSYQNPVATLSQNTNEGDENLINASYKIDYELLKGLTLSTFGSILKFNNTYGKYSPTNSYLGLASFGSNGMVSVLGKGNASRATSAGLDKTLNFLANYKTRFGSSHNFDITGGYEYYDNTREGFSTATSGFITDQFLYNNLGGANILTTSDISASSSKNNYLLISFLSRINYGYKGKYLLTLNGRYDGSSKLGKSNKWGFFPSAAAAWSISEEGFMKGSNFFNNLKLRIGFGETGNVEPIDPYNSLFLYKPTGSYYSNGVFNRGFSPSQINNEDLKWERRQMTNIGLDFGILRNKVSGTIEYYTSKTKDLLFEYGIPSPPLPFDRVKANAGTLSNKGIDITLNAQVMKKANLSWNSSLILSTVKNEILDLSGSFTYAGQTYALNTPRVSWGVANGQGLNQIVSYLQPGQPFAAFFLRQFNGVDAAGKQLLSPTDATSEDRTWIDPWNDFTFGWNNFINYKAFDFNVVLRGQVGGKVFNGTYLNFANTNRFNNNGNVLSDALNNGIKTPAELYDYAAATRTCTRQ